MAKGEASVEELVAMIARGELRLPEMQRRYVWRASRVRDLLDSLYRGYPSGTILLWETDDDVPLQEFSVKQEENVYQTMRLLLDGQQRLTSLSAVIRGEPVKVKGRKRPVEILFNLEHPEELAFVTEVEEGFQGPDDELSDDAVDSSEDELQRRFDNLAFVVGTRKLASRPHWVRVTDVFKSDSDGEFLKRAGVTSFDDPRYVKYTQRLMRLRGIRKYVYRMDILERSMSYDEVTEIFVRVNSLGAKLRSSDLALAQITAKWRGSLETFQAFQAQCSKAGFELELGIHLKNLVAFATGQSRFKTVGRLPVDELKEAWEQSVEGMEFALNFMASNAKIDSPALLASPFLLITVAYYGHERGYNLSADEAEHLRRWVLLANAKGRYSRGATETMLDQDLATIRAKSGVEALIDRLRLQVGRLDVTPEELEGRNQRSALFKTMFLAFREAGAQDWTSKLKIALNHRGASHSLQFHHVFPKSVLRGRYTNAEINDVANLVFLAGRTNRQISNKEPAEYLPKILAEAGPQTFEVQAVPTDQELLSVEAYRSFLRERRKRIADRLNDFLSPQSAYANVEEERF